jgi:hypothetical protein
MLDFENLQISGEPFINKTCAVGYFGNDTTSTTKTDIEKQYDGQGLWHSVGPCTLTDDGGIAGRSNTNGLKLLHTGTYRLSLSIDITAMENDDADNTSEIAFGTSNLDGKAHSIAEATFIGRVGGGNSIGNYFGNKGIYSIGNIQYINWVVNGYSNSGYDYDTPLTLFVQDGSNHPIWYRFKNRAGGNNDSHLGILTTELVFTNSTANTELYFNIKTNKDHITMGRCYFVLQLLSTSVP